MNNDRHGESCAREVGARVDEHQPEQPRRELSERGASESGCRDERATRADSRRGRTRNRAAKRTAPDAPSTDAAPLLTDDWSEYRERLLRLFFREAAPLAARYRISADDLLERARACCAASLERGAILKPVTCIVDFTVATACCLGRANAWNELWVFAEPSMTRAAFSRLPESHALIWTRRNWTRLERASRDGTGGLVRFDGLRPIRLWLVEQLLASIEEERIAGRLEIRREQLGRPVPLRLVGEMLA